MQDLQFPNEPSLGKGRFGEVRLVRHSLTKELYALKSIPKAKALVPQLEVLKCLDHPSVLKVFSSCEDDEAMHLLLECAPKASLLSEIKRLGTIDENLAKEYFKTVCAGLQYLHAKGVIHRALKPHNVLFSNEDQVKICDFGWIEAKSEEIDYIPPEILRGCEESPAVDVWGLGVLLFEMLHGYPPFNAKDVRDKIALICKAAFKCDFFVSRKAVDLISKLLVQNPADRLTLEEALAHPWLATNKFSQIEISTPPDEDFDELDILNSIEKWCKTPAKRKRQITQVDNLEELNVVFERDLRQIDPKTSRLERKSSIQNFEELSERGSWACEATKQLQDDPKTFKTPEKSSPSQRFAKRIKGRYNSQYYDDSRQEIEARLMNFYNSVTSEDWLERKEVVKATETEDCSLTDRSADAAEQDSKGHKPIEEAKEFTETRTPRQSYKAPKESSGGLFNWLGALFGCVERR
jgi:serine/threonine protein kinase